MLGICVKMKLVRREARGIEKKDWPVSSQVLKLNDGYILPTFVCLKYSIKKCNVL